MKRVVISLIVITVLATAFYYSGKKVFHWNRSSVQDAVEKEQERWMVDVEKLKVEVKDLQKELYTETKMETHEQKVSEILGTPEGMTPPTGTDTPGCLDSEKRLISFFDYLNKKYPAEMTPLDRFQKALSRLAVTPPEIMEKDLDTLALFRNIAHLYRAIGATDLRVFKQILEQEPDAVEAFLPDLYKVMMDGTCTRIVPAGCTHEVSAHYATFFLNTLAGRSYLLRRTSRYRILASYYAVRVLHQADLSGSNLYGVDILPAVKILQSDIALYKGLAQQKEYLATLEKIHQHYRR
ncbi:hypothetical protein [Desulfoluna sp.]|uniref:hypothetical protein n=1 Tax=Desulfoluna sp. TaxID=2045199 RepID=UPI002628F682|nr:hypothetical protein [Desulfoluna sp.]